MAQKVSKLHNLISAAQLVKKMSQHGYEGKYTEHAIYKLLEKYGITSKKEYGGVPYFNRKNACDCIERHIFELREMAEQLEQQELQQQREVGYDRNDMSAVSRELLANDGVFGADENELYATKTENKKRRITITEAQYIKYFKPKKGRVA